MLLDNSKLLLNLSKLLRLMAFVSLFCFSQTSFAQDNDLDGIVDEIDFDDDNDGILDTDEGCGNLIINGSFEQQDFTNATIFPGGFTGPSGTFMGTIYNTNTLTGWSYTQNIDGWVAGGSLAPAYHGVQYLDLIGNNNVTGGVSNELSQIINTVPGTTYTLSFYWGEDRGHAPPEVVTMDFDVIDSGNASITNGTLTTNSIGPIASISGPNNWFYHEETFVATTVQTTIWFTATPPGAGDTSAGAALDFVGVVATSNCRDTDNDGVIDAFDLDSDNDGIYDAVEAGHDKAHTNGMVDGTVGTDGVPDTVQTSPNGETANYTITESTDDTDTIPNFLDQDSDGDGIPDNVEAQTTIGYIPPNADDAATYAANNGANSAYLGGLNPVNTDLTDNPDYLDIDSDNDGASDSEEAGIAVRGIDQDQDGLDHVTDTDDQAAYDDANGTIDNPSLLPDTDNDINSGGDVDYRDASDDRSDTDLDGIIDVFDLDDDNDGILDTDECLRARFDTGTTLAIASDDFNWKVQWIVGPADYAPPAIPEIVPAVITGNLATTAWVNTPVGSNSEWISHPFNDAIGGIGNHIDADLDGVPFERPFLGPPSGPTADFVLLRFSNTINLPIGAAATFFLGFDMAADNGTINNNVITPPVQIFVNGVLQTTPPVDFDRLTNINLASDWVNGDNTIEIIIYSSPPIAGLLIANTNSTFGNCDLDGDGIVNQLDLDSDNDGVYDVVESSVLANGVLDDNNDGRIDGDSTAFGNNGLFNGIENNDTFNATTTYTLAESTDDTDAIPNYLDIDSDGDGIPDNVEAQTTLGYIPPNGTVDGNGVDTAYTNGIDPVNTDGTDSLDYLDLDSDNDNVPDNIEGHDADHNGIADQVSIDVDTDGDGLDDAFEGTVIDDIDANDAIDDPINDLPNTDGDEESDYRDIDDDNDGIETRNEDENGDGDYSNDDVDNNGIPDYLEPNYLDVEVFNAITPNGDGVHDVLTIQNIEQYPENTISIYNRWGVLIYETHGYHNQTNYFDGISQARATMGNSEELPTGTYFYILSYEETLGSMKSLSGYLYLSR